MAGMIQFVANYDDLSTDKGYQFKFHCDKCGNGFMSRYEASAMGTAASFLSAAGNVFGGILGSAGNSAYEIQRAVGGKAHDGALERAVQEGKQHFHQCTRCGKWVCPEVCWNARAGMCEECAPDEQEELAAQKAQATAEQIYTKTREQDYTSDLNFKDKGGLVFCSDCGTKMNAAAKFCPECGTPNPAARPAEKHCANCGVKLQPGAKFCPECGTRA
ncbi:MAG TPA: zinc-ribbon domain-containing protein [Armatimonadaceae bacterium]|nr:zinc-ribbon domain-containing protein [Armatimonadaceae bacterium]